MLTFAATKHFTITIKHLSGVDNSTADALFLLQVERFRTLAPFAIQKPTITPAFCTIFSPNRPRINSWETACYPQFDRVTKSVRKRSGKVCPIWKKNRTADQSRQNYQNSPICTVATFHYPPSAFTWRVYPTIFASTNMPTPLQLFPAITLLRVTLCDVQSFADRKRGQRWTVPGLEPETFKWKLQTKQ